MGNTIDDIAGTILDALGYAADKATYPTHAVADKVGLGDYFPDYEYQPGQGAEFARGLRGESIGDTLSNLLTKGVPQAAKNALTIGGGLTGLEGLANLGLKAGAKVIPGAASSLADLAKAAAGSVTKKGLAQAGGLGGLIAASSFAPEDKPQAPAQTEDLTPVAEEPKAISSKKTGLPRDIIRAALENKLVTMKGDEFSASENPGPGSFSKTPSNFAAERYARSTYALKQLDDIEQKFQQASIQRKQQLMQMYEQGGDFAKALRNEVISAYKGTGQKAPGEDVIYSEAVRRIDEIARSDANAMAVPANLRTMFERRVASESKSPAAVDNHALASAPTEEKPDRSWIGTGMALTSMIALPILLAKMGKGKEAVKALEQVAASVGEGGAASLVKRESPLATKVAKTFAGSKGPSGSVSELLREKTSNLPAVIKQNFSMGGAGQAVEGEGGAALREAIRSAKAKTVLARSGLDKTALPAPEILKGLPEPIRRLLLEEPKVNFVLK